MTAKLYLLLMVYLTSCIHSNKKGPSSSSFPKGTNSSDRAFSATSEKGMITSAHPLASRAGLNILKKGGNAVDAAVAVTMAISVVRPQSTGIGGGGFLLHYDKRTGSILAYDFRETAPQNASRDMYLDKNKEPKDFFYKGDRVPNASVNGHLSVATPGLIRGIWEVHQSHGSLPWKELFQDAIKLAQDGFVVYPNLEKAINRRIKILNAFPSTRKIFLPNGKVLGAGEILIQKDLAKTLIAIAEEGPDVFYRGWIAQKIVNEMKDGGGVLQLEDLHNYQVKLRKPIESNFLDYTLFSMPPPSSGGVHVAQMLNMAEEADLEKEEHLSPEYIHTLVEIMRMAYADRAEYLGDSDFISVPVKGLISKDYAASLVEKIPRDKAGNSKDIGPGNPTQFESPSTTHFSIVDQWGNSVSSTQTINYGFGSGVVAEGTGIVLNDEMDDFSKKPGVPNAFGLVGSKANEIQPLKRMLSSMSPSFVFKDDELDAVLGSPGGSRIINATLQTIIHRYFLKMSPIESVHSTRIHHQWLPDKIFMEETSISLETQDALRKMGYELQESSFPIGDVQAIFREKNQWWGVSDTRSDGEPMAY